MSSSQVKVAVFGASGYSGIELLRLLLAHPEAELVAVTSRALAGKPLTQEFPRFRGVGNADSLSFTAPDAKALASTGAEDVFLALPHGVSADYAVDLLDLGHRVLDLSADFRLRDPKVYADFYNHPHPAPALLGEAVYGLPEVRPEAIQAARLIACPGCYPTSILLPLIPLLSGQLLASDPIAVSSMSGASGAGRKEAVPLLFGEIQNSLRPYSVPRHRHLSEIRQELALAAGKAVKISFVPHIVPVHAGICSTIFANLKSDFSLDQVGACLDEAYKDAPFVRLLGANGCPDTKNVVGTNFIDIGWSYDADAERLILLSAEDNLGKGAASQAVQNFNLAHGFDPATGLLPGS